MENVPAQDAQDEAEPVLTDATIRLDTTKFTHGTVHNAQPLDEPNDEPTPVPEQTPAEDAFEGDWEPEYEQPIGEYIPPQPIIFHPRSRLRELKKKLVSGPERRYYELSGKGIGKLQVSIFLSFLIVVISAVTTSLFAFGVVPASRLRLMVFSQFLILLISALLGYSRLIEGATDLCKGRFTLNTLLVFTFLFCLADGILGLDQQRISCCAAFSLSMLMSQWSAYQRTNTQIGQMDTLRKANTLDAVSIRSQYCDVPTKKGSQTAADGLLRDDGQPEDFMEHYCSASKSEKIISLYALLAMLISFAIGILSAVLNGITAGIQTLAVTLLAATPATIFITLSRPYAILEQRLHKLGTVLCGWEAIERLHKPAVFPVTFDDLFPAGCTKLNGMKFFGKHDPDEMVAYATALVEASGSGLAPLFSQLLLSHNGRHHIITDVQLYSGGVSGNIGGQTVLAGSRTFLKEMGVEVPEGSRVSSAVYLAVEKELCALFAITYEIDRAAAAGISALCAAKGLNPIVVSDDFVLTESFLRTKFNIPAQRVILPEFACRNELREKQISSEDPVALLSTSPKLAAFAFGVAGAKTLNSACRAGILIHLLGGIAGLATMLVLTLVGATALLTPVNMFLYQLVWMIPGLLVTEWTRHL